MSDTQNISVAAEPPVWINDGPDCYCCDCGHRLVYGSCPNCDRDLPRHCLLIAGHDGPCVFEGAA